ncbi:MAG: ABC transporter permease [Pirellulales bacterium]|nr:ABC transporter permease [Pirellulales bacterium]
MKPVTLLVWLLDQSPVLLCGLVLLVFAAFAPQMLAGQNLLNILEHSSGTGIAAVGMTLVLLTGGVDLSIGSLMFVAMAVSGKMIAAGQPIWLSLACGVVVGLAGGAINGLLITRLRVLPFIATLAMLFILRGLGLWLTQTRALNMPSAVTELAAARWGWVPLPILLFGLVACGGQWWLSFTAAGRQIYALGSDPLAAQKAGVRVTRLQLLVYVLSGGCAALSGCVLLMQTGAVSPNFGEEKEFIAIAAAVLGGTSLFGGRGKLLPGTLCGAILFQTIETGLVQLRADPYAYPVARAGLIFAAVLLDTTRARLTRRLTRRQIRVE